MSLKMAGFNRRRRESLVEILRSREEGLGSIGLECSVKYSLVKLLINCWSCGRRTEFHRDIKTLIGRSFSLWESRMMYHLAFKIQKSKRTFSSVYVPSKMLLEQISTLGLKFNFTELMELILENGIDLGLRTEDDLSLLMEDMGIIGKEKFITFVIRHATRKNDERLLGIIMNILLDSYKASSNEKELDSFERILKTGYHGHDSYLQHLLKTLHKEKMYEKSLKLLILFLNHGFDVNVAFQCFCSYETIISCLKSATCFENVLAFVHLFNHNGASLPEERSEEQFSVSKVFKSVGHDSNLASVISFCIECGAHLLIEDNDGANLLMIICKYYQGDDLAEVVSLLCKGSINVNCIDYLGNNALNLLAIREPKVEVHSSVRMLLKYKVDVNHLDSVGLNALQRFVYHETPSCCNFDLMRKWRDCGFWSSLSALVDAGSRVEPLIYNGSSLVLEMLKRSHGVCDSCAKITDSNVFWYAFQFINRLLEAGASVRVVYSSRSIYERESVLFYVCANFKGEQLVRLVELFCRYGVDVNATTTVKMKSEGSYRYPLDAIQVMKRENPTECHLISRLVEILKKYGFNNCD